MMTSAVGPASVAATRIRRQGQLGDTTADRFLRFFIFVLWGYAVGSKGFAYLGVSPIFIGELSLIFGLFALWCARKAIRYLPIGITSVLVLFMAFSAIRTIAFVGTYGIMALRDAALYGYGLFALIVAVVMLSRPPRLSFLLHAYRLFVPVFLLAAPIIWLATILLAGMLPKWPGTDVTIIYVKAADLLVHLSGIAAFMCVGLGGPAVGWVSALLAGGVVLTGFQSRGGLLAFLSALTIAFIYRPRARTVWHLVRIVLAVAVLLGTTGVVLRFPGFDREISFRQFVEHLESTAGNSSAQDLENTKEWRLAWWATIIDYTLMGDYFWAGKGYGINLASDDGFQASTDDSLRSPHNVHMTVLARSGVIGLLLWIVLQTMWVARTWRCLRDARKQDQRTWAAIFAFLLAYWLAFLVNASFDVYLEGPTGGIWFWSVFGLGLATTQLFKNGENASLAPTSGSFLRSAQQG